jgi:hypothetical protein
MKKTVLVTGASGFLGKPLTRRLEKDGWHVIAARRCEGQPTEIGDWNTESGEIRLPDRPLDAVVNLAGRSITKFRWTSKEKERLYQSRVPTTAKLSEHLKSMDRIPKVWVGASGIGLYGDRGDQWIDEQSPMATSFMAGMARDWESAAEPVATAGSRLVILRFSMILGPYGGAWPVMKIPFQLGLGGVIGSGDQYWSWVHFDDVIRLIMQSLQDGRMEGPYNAASPNPLPNREFTAVIGRVLGRPTIIPLPSFAVNLLFGEMGRELFLSSQRCHSARLAESGFDFRFTDLEKALRSIN